LNVVYSGSNGPAEVLLYRDAEPRLELVKASRAFSFDGDGETFRIASEAQRIRLAHLFDPYLAIHSSRIEPLPHQIAAVYGEMLPRQPLKFLLADDPGAGNTIMAGLFIKELIIRGDLERCLIIAPGSRKVTQIVFKPDWDRDGKAAPFKRYDALLAEVPQAVIVFPGTGITDNLADKAKRLGIRILDHRKEAGT
jgi:hypothetical protein